MIEPKYPIGTPEYEAYAAELREELRKLAAGKPPYDNFNLFDEIEKGLK